MDLASARTYYLQRKYTEAYVPTLVDGKIINATCPPHGDFRPEGQVFHVASAEQGFLQMLYDGFFLQGKHQTTTACQRPCDKDRGPLYKEWFLKLELYDSDPNNWEELLSEARELYSHSLNVPLEMVQIEETDLGKDLVCKGIEIGSYGIREALGYTWSYGTGFVPFRFGIVKDLIKGGV